MKKHRVMLIMVLFLLGCLGGFFVSQSGDDLCVFTVTVESDRPVETQLFYDTGKGFNETESRRAVVYHSGQAVTLSFLLPGDKLRRFRFDPARSAAAMCIRHAAVTCEEREPFVLSLETLIPQQGIRLLRQDGGRLCFETEGEDPILLLKEIGVRPRRWVRSFLYSLGGGILALAGAFSLAWLYKRA
jgi:hypothetical protein